jgi:hypothetical protein
MLNFKGRMAGAIGLICATVLPAGSMALVAEKPNVIMVLVDDMGWGDIGLNGHPYIKTPNIDAMAENGELVVKSLRSGEFDVSSIGSVSTINGKTLKWKQDEKGLKVSLPEKPASEYAYVFKVVSNEGGLR